MSEWLWDWSPEWQMHTTNPRPLRLTDEEVRRIVREELADLIQTEAPDAPPENL